ncbi:alpha-L-arabinofuranosidase C-terminal domain-containing protein [Flavobacterium seoulense]|uniref:non-reducing end alpha-L-arabinofuranosidase n=1 Tax=Flavobacterium seoulense TaxID=1492738 RepID=A0A066WVY4_9FLAO|nr:alpha-L-arabinofuranosidase C-terminal domain-containing protein [Flavobacterium seoulense]KDN54805.1 alpha-L-arabinofuranosidase [Flavobacterium seoulense]
MKNQTKLNVVVFVMSVLMVLPIFAEDNKKLIHPGSVYLFAYTPENLSGRTGLQFAWSIDKKSWNSIGQNFNFLLSDYGRWGAQKKMQAPYLFQDNQKTWHCVWTLNDTDGTFAHAASKDLISWGRQSYPPVMTNNNCLQTVVSQDKGIFTVSWLSSGNSKKEFHAVTTTNFVNYSNTKNIQDSDRVDLRETIAVGGINQRGTVYKVNWELVNNLIKAEQLGTYNNQLKEESSKTDATRFAGLKPVNATITVNASQNKKISNMLTGIFFEDINYAADGGLYAELIQNRGFEYTLSDKQGRDKSWDSKKAWSISGNQNTFSIDSVMPIHDNNKHYAVLKTAEVGKGLSNEGFDGIALKAGDKYDFSLFTRNLAEANTKLLIRLVGKNGEKYGETTINSNSTNWKKYTAVLVSNKTAADAKLEIIPQSAGSIALDMISLFPQKTFKGRKNGLRADLAQTIADIQPKFMRFPGGCVAHGNGLENIYHWKNTIGPLEARKPQRNLWNYHQSMGLGYFEYFQFCEDMGAAPLPVVAAGVPCQNSGVGGEGQQGGIPMEEMDEYVQDVLDLIEYANGSVNTKWGKKRAEAGHPKPFNLKYIGVGNEDLITDIFEERFTMIFNAVKAKYPEITVIGTVGPFYEGTDYNEGWAIADKLNVPMVDEHYYESVGWFINNQDFYDKYDRSKAKVYLGEYAAFLPGRPNNIETALAEALYLTSVERNGDVVSMASIAPMLAKEGHTQWNPDIIYFNNSEVKPTVGYQVQKMYGNNPGDIYFSNDISISDTTEPVRKRIGVSVVRDSKSNDLILKLVNMLPVAVNTQLNLKNLGVTASNASRTLLTGAPDSKTALPKTDTISVNEEFSSELPAYSFSLIRIKTKK